MRILITASSENKAKNYVDFLRGLGRVDVSVVGSKVDLREYDLLVLSGGEDVDPSFYKEHVKYDNVVVDRRRDEYEFEKIEEFLRLNKPIFGICRGFQVLTVFFGGSLYQDLVLEGFNPHRGEDGGDIEHLVEFSGMFEEEFGSEGLVNSNHHQGLKGFPEKLEGEILAVSKDHLVEAFFSKKHRVLAVQWHPERHDSEISIKLLELLKTI